MTVKEKIEQACAQVEEDTNFDILAEMKAALNSVYGEERNQILKPSYDLIIRRAKEIGVHDGLIRMLEQKDPSGVSSYLKLAITDVLSYQIVIHFPEITIKNENQEHLIRDIYVRAFLRPNGLLASYIQGMRTTVTEAEFVSKYVHSHLPSLKAELIGFHNFCTGVGEINQVLALLNTKYSSANFMMFLMHIKNYLEWESKEGHPYMFIENVFNRSSRGRVYSSLPDWIVTKAANAIIDRIITTMTIETIMKMFNFTVDTYSITASPTLELEKWMATVIENWDQRTVLGGDYQQLLLCIRDNAGNYHALPETGMRRLSYERGPILNFKGRDIEFEIIEKSQTQTNETFANPKVTKETCEKLSRKLSKTALTSAGIKSGGSLIYSSGATKTDNISV